MSQDDGCPRCHDAIQPFDKKGLRSRPVEGIPGVLFCVFCAEYIKERPAVREKYAALAKTQVEVKA